MTQLNAASRRTAMTCRNGAAAIAATAVALFSIPALAQSGSFEPDFRDLTLGVPATEMSIEGYDAISCGSNGGPPLRALANWAQYDQCRPDRDGFYEVAAEFGLVERITAERLAAMYNGQVDYSRGGTRFDQFPVVLSVLFDEDGISRGIRIVTDQRAPVGDRARAHLLPLQIIPRYAARGEWDCVDNPQRPGFNPVGETYIDRNCTIEVDGKRIVLVSHFYRKPGQSALDPYGQPQQGQFESLARWEIWDAEYLASKEQ